MAPLNQQAIEIRQLAESDLQKFINLVHPLTVLGGTHKDVIDWWSSPISRDHQLLLLPRDHQKSRLLAYRVVWYLTKYPDRRVLYMSSTSNLAEKQLKFMKDIFTSKIYRRYWPEMVNENVDKRERWTSSEISLDHPLRKTEGVRDPSIFTGGLTTSLTGMHCDVAALDDVVVQENAYTREGRNKVATQYSLLSSIEGTAASEWVVGTRYDPRDLYNDMMDMKEEVYDDKGDITDMRNVYEKFERQVEDRGDGTGEFIWPRQQRQDGKWFGFDATILARKRAKYLNKTQYRAQYYNDPSNPGGAGITQENFQYYDKGFLQLVNGHWHYKGERLSVFAAIDFAFSTTQKSDYTALVVIGMDSNGFIYVLDIDRFKTERIKDYFTAIQRGYVKWGYRKLRAETVAGQKTIVKELKNNYIRNAGLSLSVDEYNPPRSLGSKEERINSILRPKYEDMAVFHYRDGNCQLLEDELSVANPAHDDIKDALAAVIDIGVPPISRMGHGRLPGGARSSNSASSITFHSRFGGVA
tara:strand:+ start:1741 stop:3318 length:1578 start_codon:yes stop_codon:yes gene_type:complete